MSKELIRLRDLCMAFDDEPVLDHINLYINDKEFLTLLGPSGCGKTTTLRIIGGFATPTSGDVLFDGVRINDVPPYQRQINTVFQKYALFPHLNVYENIAFGLRMQKLPEAEIKERVMEMLETVSLKGFEHRRPEALSGGQQQRVAIARALVNRPKVLLLDEPLAALDLKLRKDMQIELKRIQQQVGITFIYVTHDQEEALTMSDTIVVMDKGSIQQIGTPEDIYNEPKNAFVADFIGESNIIDGIMPEDNVVQMYGRRFPCLDGGFAPNEAVDVVIRPEDIDIVPVEQGQLTGTVTSVTFKGMQYDIIVDFRGFKWLIQTTDHCPEGARIGIKIDPDATIPPSLRNTMSWTTPPFRRMRRRAGMKNNRLSRFAIPYVIWMALFVVAPIIMVVIYAFSASVGGFTLDNFAKMGTYTVVFTRSFKLALIATAICVLIGYPVSYKMSKEGPRFQRLAMVLIMLPMWMNFLLRTYSWMAILENNGLLNQLFRKIGLIALYNNIFGTDISFFRMINTQGAVVLGMVYNYLPFMILPIYSVIVKLDHSLIEAARDLGANSVQVFRRVILPLSLPGVLSGITMVFVPSVSTFAISKMLGGGTEMLLGDLIEQQYMGGAYNPYLGAAISLVMMVIVVICMVVMNRFGEGEEQAVMM